MVAEDLCAQRNGVPCGDGAVRPDLQGQFIVVGHVANTGVLHRVVDLDDRGIDGIYRDNANDGLRGLVPVGGHIAPALAQGQFHVQGGVGAQGGDEQIRVEDLHLAVRLDVPGGDFALAAGLDIHPLGAVAVQLGDDLFDVEDDLRYVFLHAGDGAELVLHTGDLDGSHGGAGQGAEQDTAQGVAQGRTIPPLQRLDNIFTIRIVARVFDALNARLFDFYHISFTLLICGTRRTLLV